MTSHRIFLFSALALAYPFHLSAVETKMWSLETKADYDKAKLEKVALRSDGKLTLAPSFTELLDSEEPYLWAVAQDSKGNIYAGGGSPGASTAKLFSIDRNGKSKKLAELPGSEIHALAIDKKDRVFAATSPDGKVYLVNSAGKSEVYYDPKAKYIWALALNSAGELFVATGDKGEIHKVTAAGKGTMFYKTEETHARSMAIDGKDNLIVGTEPGGLILRVSTSGAGFVLHQAAKKEVTAVAIGKDGAIFAAAVGGRTSPMSAPAAPAPPPPAVSGSGPAPAPQAPLSFAPTFTGGSEVYRIAVDGSPSRIWTESQDTVYSLVIGCDGKPTVATGNKGRIYRIDSDQLSTQLIASTSTQITQLVEGQSGNQCALLAVTANLGKVFRMGPGTEAKGTVTGDALDAGWFSRWGRLTARRVGEGTITLESRSGNTDRPGANWSPWTAANDRMQSPAARFLQYRLTLDATSSKAPEVSGIDIAYLPKNVAPTVDEIEISPGNYKYPVPTSLTTSSTKTLKLSPIGQKSSVSIPGLDSPATEMNYAKGFIGARWRAADRNGDTMQYKVELKGAAENEWKLLKDKLTVKNISWDASAFSDGEYNLRVTANDQTSNPEGQGLSGSLISDPFIVDNTPPSVTALTTSVTGNKVTVTFKASDLLSLIERTEYSVNGSDWLLAEPTTGVSDSKAHEYVLGIEKTTASELTIAVRVTDEWDNQTVAKTVVR